MPMEFKDYEDEDTDFEIYGEQLSNGNYGLYIDGLNYEIYIDSDGYYSVKDEPTLECQCTLDDAINLVHDHVMALRMPEYVKHKDSTSV